MGKRKDLRERVQHQAYLYRVNADLRGDKIHPLVDLSETTPRADRRENKGQQVRCRVSPRTWYSLSSGGTQISDNRETATTDSATSKDG